MPNRILRDGILTSPRVSKLNWAEEVFYRRLHSIVDDFGRYYADLGLLRAACYPRQLNKVSDSDIEKWLAACAEATLVRVYPALDGERYLEVLDFNQQVRAKKSKFLSFDECLLSKCVANDKQKKSNAHLDVSGDGVVSVSVNSEAKASATDGGNADAELTKKELWTAGKSLLAEQGMAPAQCGSFVGKLVKDYGDQIVVEAVRTAVVARPADAAEYLKATCMHASGQRQSTASETAYQRGKREQYDAMIGRNQPQPETIDVTPIALG